MRPPIDKLRIAGYAALFGRRDAGRDVIRQGAFARTLAEARPIPLFWLHRPDLRVGWVEHLAEDARGLRVIAGLDRAEGSAAAALRQRTVTGSASATAPAAFAGRAKAASCSTSTSSK